MNITATVATYTSLESFVASLPFLDTRDVLPAGGVVRVRTAELDRFDHGELDELASICEGLGLRLACDDNLVPHAVEIAREVPRSVGYACTARAQLIPL